MGLTVMKENIRRILIFIVIVGAGTLFIFFDLPLLLVLPLVIAIGLILLILLGAVPISDLKGLFRKKSKEKPAAESGKKATGKSPAETPRKERFPSGLLSFFKRKATGKEVSSAASPQKTPSLAPETKKPRFKMNIRSLFQRKPQAQVKASVPSGIGNRQDAAPAKKKGFSLHISSLITSFRQFGTILTTKKATDPDKLKKIDTMLDAAVLEKPDSPPSAHLQHSVAQKPAAPGGNGPAPASVSDQKPAELPIDEDPFLSLADAELDAGLLEGLDDDDMFSSTPVPQEGEGSAEFTVTIPEDGAVTADTGGSAPSLSPEMASAADEILKANVVTDSGELPALEGLETVDEDLGDLDNLSLDSVDLEDDDEEGKVPDSAMAVPAPAAPSPAAPAAPPAPAPAASSGKKGSDQSEMAAFAAASGGDDDMLSSLAADIKTVKKEQDVSLLRELKDFRIPGTTIEKELTDLYTTLNVAAEKQKKIRSKEGAKKPQAK